MRLLIDANIFLEVILERAHVAEARQFLALTEGYDFFISDYALHSIGTFLFKLKKKKEFSKLLQDLKRNDIDLLLLDESELERVAEISDQFNLDFDDAYQYAIAEKHNLTLVSFDKDFDRTDRGRKTPSQILNSKS